MKVRTLIKKLEKMDPNREVVVVNDDSDEMPIDSIEESKLDTPKVVAIFPSYVRRSILRKYK